MEQRRDRRMETTRRRTLLVSAGIVAFAVAWATLFLQRDVAKGVMLSAVVQTGGDWKQVRQEFYHRAQGTRLMPMSWFLALEQKDAPAKFASPEYLGLFGFLRDAQDDRYNPDGLPVGFTRTRVPGAPDYLGVNCAFCHTGQIHYTDPATYRQYSIRIDGGSSMQFNARFMKELLGALRAAVQGNPRDPDKRARFVASIKERDPAFRDKTPADILGAVTQFLLHHNRLSRLDPFEWGFGRFDALGNGGNLIFTARYPDAQDNVRVANGPVSIPSLWGTTSYDRMQWNGSVRNFLARGIAEAWSVGAKELDLHELKWMEEVVAKITAPPWPDVFPPIDFEKAEAGRALYREKCMGCHGMPGSNPKLILQSEIFTDPTAARNYANRRVSTGNEPRRPAAAVMEELTEAAIATGLARANLERWGNPNRWSYDLGYLARPLDGIWATPPYLHNGSVPNLYQLLSPVKERSKCFYVDNREYDPIRVGFALRRCDFQSRFDDPATGFELDTTRPGNYNSGHEFAGTPGKPMDAQGRLCNTDNRPPGVLGCTLHDYERWQLLEYLKALPDFPAAGAG
jgi:hypothetical protein